MHNKLSFLLTFIPCLLFAQVKVHTQQGDISGIRNGEMSVYKGVPFASPPVGALRWKAPQPLKKWKGVLACNRFSASAMQSKPVPFMMWTEEFIAPPEPLSEDCLYLNIWTKSKTGKEKMPVMVWIHGGGLMSGAASCAVYDGEEMAKKDVVYVSINYRVGVFGFLSLPELTSESGVNASGNYGFMDQIAALKWIQQNIAAFGGDPNNVTIAGQSAGSFSVNALVASPLAKGLFHKAIAQSGGLLGGRMARHLPDAEKSGIALMKQANATNLNELRKLSAEEVLKAASSMPFGTFGSVIDGYVLPDDILTLFKNGKHNDVPLLTGWVMGDASLMGNQYVSAEKFIANSTALYGNKTDEFLILFPAANDEEAKSSQIQLALFSFAGMPSRLWAGFNKSKSYLYEFSHVPAPKPDFPDYGAFHTSEVPYALHTLHMWKRPWTAVDYQVEQTMFSYWINFVKTGDPNGSTLVQWKAYDKTSGDIMEMGDQFVSKPALYKPQFDFLESLLK